MHKFLFVVPPFVGHINPTVSVGQELRRRGHGVAWVGFREPLVRLLPPGAELIELAIPGSGMELSELKSRFHSVRGFHNLKLMWEEVFIPLARSTFPGVMQAAKSFQPDVLVTDQQALAGALAARKLGLTWATSAATPADRVTTLQWLPKVLNWIDDLLADLQRELNLEPVAVPEDSPDLVLEFITEELTGPATRYPSQYRMVGPAITRRPDRAGFPWERLGDTPKVLVSLGTLNAERGHEFFGRVVDALGGLPIQAIMAAPESFGPFPDNFIVQPWVPQLELLPRIDLLLSHAGSNTVCEALAHGLPVVVLPITDGQPVVAQQVAESGCGLRLSFKRSGTADIRAAVERGLSEPSFREAAQRIKASFERAGGAPRAADLLEALAEGRPV